MKEIIKDEKNIEVEKIIKDRLESIWKEFFNLDESLMKRRFVAPKTVTKNSIMFLGINPSYDPEKDNGPGFYEIKNEGYFKKFDEIGGKLVRKYQRHDIVWTHIDLLYFRETNQKEIDKFIYNNTPGQKFLYDQLMLSKELLEMATPKIIVASNTKVRQLLGFNKKVEKNEDVWIGYDFKFDDSIGTYRIKNDGMLKNVPIFFTSMLTGQRALDNGSFERLIWHINFVLGKIS
jgi:hypothetical protein